MRKKVKYKIRRTPLDITADFQWSYTYNNEYKTLEEAKAFLRILADECLLQHNVERHDIYFIDNTTQTKYEILYI